MTITEQIKAILAESTKRAEAATPGPWTPKKATDRLNSYHVLISENSETPGWVVARMDQTVLGKESINADFIAHSRTDLPARDAALRVAVDALDQSRSYMESNCHSCRALSTILAILKGEK